VQIFFLALFEEKLNKLPVLDQLNICRISGTGYPALLDIRLDIQHDNLVSGRIPDIKKGRIIRPDIRCIPND
jgi:hypothetical protein